MAESGASTACGGWPLCNGSALPAADEQEVTHMVHRFLAGLLAAPLVWLAIALWNVRRAVAWARPIAFSVIALYGSQVMVGAFNVWYEFPDALTISHTAIAACLWVAVSAGAALGLLRAQVRAPSHLRASEALTA
jgi:heme A synthase